VREKKKAEDDDDQGGNDCANYFGTRESRHFAILTPNAERRTPNTEW